MEILPIASAGVECRNTDKSPGETGGTSHSSGTTKEGQSQICQQNPNFWCHPIFSSTTTQKRCERFLKPSHSYQEQWECILLGTGITEMFGQVSFFTKKSMKVRFMLKCNRSFQACFKDKIFLRGFVRTKVRLPWQLLLQKAIVITFTKSFLVLSPS